MITQSGSHSSLLCLSFTMNSRYFGKCFLFVNVAFMQSTSMLQSMDASQLWLKYEALTSNLSQMLCEELRLVLQPTQAAQLK